MSRRRLMRRRDASDLGPSHFLDGHPQDPSLYKGARLELHQLADALSTLSEPKDPDLLQLSKIQYTIDSLKKTKPSSEVATPRGGPRSPRQIDIDLSDAATGAEQPEVTTFVRRLPLPGKRYPIRTAAIALAVIALTIFSSTLSQNGRSSRNPSYAVRLALASSDAERARIHLVRASAHLDLLARSGDPAYLESLNSAGLGALSSIEAIESGRDRQILAARLSGLAVAVGTTLEVISPSIPSSSLGKLEISRITWRSIAGATALLLPDLPGTTADAPKTGSSSPTAPRVSLSRSAKSSNSSASSSGPNNHASDESTPSATDSQPDCAKPVSLCLESPKLPVSLP